MGGPEATCAAFVLAWAVGLVALCFRSWRRRRERLRADIVEAARRLGGTVIEGRFRHLPDIRFALGPALAEVRFRQNDGRRGISLEYRTPPRPLVCTVYPCGGLGRFLRFFRIAAAETGDIDFDRAFTVESNDAGFIRRWLSPDARATLFALQRLLGPDFGLRVSLAGQRLRVEGARPLQGHPVLVTAVQLANRFAELTLEALGEAVSAAGIQVLEVSLGEASCQVCGETIASAPVLCRRCRTPHHRDCWEYLGGCSTFACKTREYVAG